MISVFLDPFLYFGIAVWPVSYFLWKTRFTDKIRSFKGFHFQGHYIEMRTPTPANFLGPQKFYWNTYQALSVMAIAAFLYIMLFFTKFDQNIVMLRVANLTSVFGTGHYMIWVAAFIVYLRFGAPFDFIRGIYAMAFFGALHELLFYATWVSLYGFSSLYMNSPFLILISGMLFGFLLLFRKEILSWKRITIIIGAMSMFYFLWGSAGFPVTLNIDTGHTIFFSNMSVNLIEDLSWLMPAFLFL